MVYDTVMLFNELDMLECRLTEFEQLPYPVTHVIVESRFTHRGDPKPLYFMENMSRFDRWITGAWRGRVRYITVDRLEKMMPWDREHEQRNHCRDGITDAKPDDIILHGDLDEIPRMSALADTVKRVTEDGVPRSLVMSQHLYAVDWYHPNLEQALTVVIRKRDITGSFTELRQSMGQRARVENGGWHLSWIGGHEANLAKLGVHCHLEMTPEEQYWPESGRAYREGRTHGGVWQVPIEVPDDYPLYIRERRCPDTWFRPQRHGNET
jgi:beta-1,4-mannosyl-glycoprotein beta-1,4-N-acetylglucosaminyltransferase